MPGELPRGKCGAKMAGGQVWGAGMGVLGGSQGWGGSVTRCLSGGALSAAAPRGLARCPPCLHPTELGACPGSRRGGWAPSHCPGSAPLPAFVLAPALPLPPAAKTNQPGAGPGASPARASPRTAEEGQTLTPCPRICPGDGGGTRCLGGEDSWHPCSPSGHRCCGGAPAVPLSTPLCPQVMLPRQRPLSPREKEKG